MILNATMNPEGAISRRMTSSLSKFGTNLSNNSDPLCSDYVFSAISPWPPFDFLTAIVAIAPTQPKGVSLPDIHVIAEAEFTLDMAQTLEKYFSSYEKDGVVQVEVTTHGLWLVSENRKMRHFLGLARKPSGEVVIPMRNLNFYRDA